MKTAVACYIVAAVGATLMLASLFLWRDTRWVNMVWPGLVMLSLGLKWGDEKIQVIRARQGRRWWI